MGLTHSPRIATDGLALCLDAGNVRSYPKSGTVWSDLSGNGNNGTLVNGPSFSNNNSGSIVFDGANDRGEIVYPASNFRNTSFTWCVWVIGTVLNNGPMPVIGYGSGSWPRLGFSARYSNPLVWHFGQYGNDGTGNIDMYYGSMSTTQWTYLSISADYENTVLRGYRDGVLKTTTNGWRDSNGNYGPIGIGRAGITGWPNALLQGAVSSFTIYNRALSANEIKQNYLATKGRFNL
jgi:hypothetical protein